MNEIQNTPERHMDIGNRAGISRESAQAEMDKFRGVAEYETRKILGQRSAMKQSSSSPISVSQERSERDKKSK